MSDEEETNIDSQVNTTMKHTNFLSVVVADFGSPVLLKMNYDDGCKKIILNTRNSR